MVNLLMSILSLVMPLGGELNANVVALAPKHNMADLGSAEDQTVKSTNAARYEQNEMYKRSGTYSQLGR